MEFKNVNEIKKAVRKSLGSSPRATVVRVAEGDTSLAIHVIYHETIVVRLVLNPQGTRVEKVVLNSGGWLTKTTADRMNAVLRLLGINRSVRHTYKRIPFNCISLPRSMGDSITDQKFTLVTHGENGIDPEGSGAPGLLRIESPFVDGGTFIRKGSQFVFSRPTAFRNATVMFSKTSARLLAGNE